MQSSGTVTLGLAIIWAAVILASAMALAGTECFGRILPLLGGGAAGSIIVGGGDWRRKTGGIRSENEKHPQ